MLGTGCSPKAITRETLNYFYGLVNQQYWQRQASGLALDDEYGTEQLILASQGTSDKGQYVVFGEVAVTSSSQKSGPIDAVIKVKVFDGTTEKEVRARVDDANRATLEKMLVETFESKAQREQRLKDEAYAAKLKEADALLAANKVADAIAAFKAAQTINDTNEVKTKLDAIYLRQGKYYYVQKKYDIALVQLKLVAFDPASLAEAKDLISKAQADADKATAAAKAAADKAAAAKNAPKGWKNVFSLVGESPTVITRKFAIDSDKWLVTWVGDYTKDPGKYGHGIVVSIWDSNGNSLDVDGAADYDFFGGTCYFYGAGTYTVTFEISTDIYFVGVSQWK